MKELYEQRLAKRIGYFREVFHGDLLLKVHFVEIKSKRTFLSENAIFTSQFLRIEFSENQRMKLMEPWFFLKSKRRLEWDKERWNRHRHIVTRVIREAVTKYGTNKT